MFLRKKAQSTAEYAITLGLVVALAAGVLQVALKSGVRQKHAQTMNYLLNAGEAELSAVPAGNLGAYSEEFRKTQIYGDAEFADTAVLKKGGTEKRYQLQTSDTEAVSVEKK